MNLWIIILISVISTVVGLYLIVFIFAIVLSSLFNKRIKNRLNSLNLLLVEKKDIILTINKLLKQNKIECDSSVKTLIDQINSFTQIKIDFDNHKQIENILDLCSLKLIEFINNKSLNVNNVYTELINSIKEINDSYRQNVSILNSNIIGFNYWINLKGYHWFFKLRNKVNINKFE